MKLVVVTTCASRKVAGAGAPSLADVPPSVDPAARAVAWVEHLRSMPARRVEPARLYVGDHWANSLRAFDAAKRGFEEAELWVISAGLGLFPVHPELRVSAYHASFTAGHPETVGRGMDADLRRRYHRAWWRELATLKPVAGAFLRSFEELASVQPHGTGILVIASEPYLLAVADDLLPALRGWGEPDRAIVLSAGASAGTQSTWSNWLLPIDAQFGKVVGGANVSLNARVATWLISRLDPATFGHSEARAAVATALGEAGPSEPPLVRTKMTQEELTAFIHSEMANAPASMSAMHVRLRARGLACEQKRFNALYRAVVGIGRMPGAT